MKKIIIKLPKGLTYKISETDSTVAIIIEEEKGEKTDAVKKVAKKKVVKKKVARKKVKRIKRRRRPGTGGTGPRKI